MDYLIPLFFLYTTQQIYHFSSIVCAIVPLPNIFFSVRGTKQSGYRGSSKRRMHSRYHYVDGSGGFAILETDDPAALATGSTATLKLWYEIDFSAVTESQRKVRNTFKPITE